MTTLVKLRKSTTYVPGSPGQAGYPGKAAIPAYCTTVTTSSLKKELVQIHPGIAPPYCTLGELLPPGYGLGSTCPMPPAYAVVTVDPPEYVYTTTEVCYPYQPAVPPIPYIPPTPAQTVIDYNLGWQCGANSITQLKQGAYTFDVPVGTKGAIVGLSTNTFSAGYGDVSHAFHLSEGNYRIMENGVAITGYTTFSTGDTFKVERQGETVKYYVEDVLVYTSLQAATSEEYYLKSVMYSGDDSIVDAAQENYAAGSGAITLGELESIGYGHNPTDNYSWMDWPALTSTGTGYTPNTGDGVLPKLRSQSYADFEAVSYTYLQGLRSSGHLTNGNGIVGEGGIYGGTSYSTLPAMTGFAHEPGYEYSTTELPSLEIYSAGGLLAHEFISSDIAIFAPREGYCTGLTGELGDGSGQMLTAIGSLASEGVYGESYTEISPPNGYAYSWGGGGLLAQYVPFTFSLNATGKKKTDGLNTLEVNTPSITFEGYTGGQVVGAVPSMSLDIQGSIPVIGRLTKDAPSFSITATGRTGNTAALLSKTPSMSLAAYSGGQLRASTPAISTTITATTGAVGAAILQFPRTKFKGEGRVGGDNALIATVPSLATGGVARLTGMTPRIWLRSTATKVIAAAQTEGYNVNMKNGAVTSHDYMPIIKIVEWGNEYYGVGTNGVYKMEGLTVDGSYPTSEMSITGIGDESDMQKRLSPIYFRHRPSGDVTVTVTPDEGTPREYTLYAETGDVLVTRRAKVARGMNGRSWELKVSGPSLDIDSIKMPLNELKRRLG